MQVKEDESVSRKMKAGKFGIGRWIKVNVTGSHLIPRRVQEDTKATKCTPPIPVLCRCRRDTPWRPSPFIFFLSALLLQEMK